MPFQSEKQRRYLHANHPEIAKRWERDYANGGISNHFRRKFASGSWTPGAGRDTKGYQSSHPQHTPSGNGGGGGGGGPKPHSGPTFAEIEAQKKIELAKQKAHDDAKHVAWLNQQRENKKEKVKRFKKLVDTKGYYSDKATDEEKKLHDDWLIATGQKEKMTHPVLVNSKSISDIRGEGIGEDIKTKAFYTDKSSIEDLITGDINRETNIVTPELGTISTFMHPEGIQVQTGGDKYGTIENIPLSATQSWAVNPGKRRFTIEELQAQGLKNGGILDIDASEEIISDDGNDIELTAYNAEFDDPNDLSTGVKSLFQAKDGGRIGFFTGMREAEQKEAQQDTGGGDGYQDRIIEVQDRQRKADLKNLVATGPGSDVEKYDTDLVDTKGKDVMSDAQKYNARKKTILSKYTGRSQQRKDALTKNYNNEKARQEKAIRNTLIKKGLFAWAGLATIGLEDFIGVDVKGMKLTGLVSDVMTLDKLKKDHIKTLTAMKDDLLTGVDIFNPNEMVNLDDTAFPDIMKELKELTKPREEEDTKGDGPQLPEVVPIGEEIEAYAQSDYYMSPWERMKANQAKRAMLVEKGIIQENPIVDESVTDITMKANRGGLANLFRVKNQ